MKVLITGVAGFIGFHTAKKLIENDYHVIGIDNLNDYYDQSLKKARLKVLEELNSKKFLFCFCELEDKNELDQIFKKNSFDVVINLAAQAGVRHSLENPYSYVDANLIGFMNILEACKKNGQLKHLIFASSSSVYGMNHKQPFSTSDRVDYPISLYAATKKANELMAFSYSHLFDLPVTGLRFFTVYGPFGRPDMAYFKFTKAILNDEEIDVFNNGEMLRDFTYIDDIVDGIHKVILKPPLPLKSKITKSFAKYKIYNIGNNDPIPLKKFINTIEDACKKKAKVNFLPMQPGDVPITFADINNIKEDIGFNPNTNIEEGIQQFVDWFKAYYRS